MVSQIADVDLSGLMQFNSALFGVLKGTGQDGDMQRLVQTEAGQLGDSIQEQIGPKSISKASKSAAHEIKRYISFKPDRPTINEPSKKYGGFTWLYASPYAVLGIDDSDNYIHEEGPAALSLFRQAQKSRDRGDSYLELGKRGKQHFMRLNRSRVSRKAFAYVQAVISGRVGEMKSTFAFAANQLIGKNYPEWVARHFPSARGKTIFDGSQKNDPECPSISFGSRAPGINSNPYVVKKIAGAVEARKRIIASKIDKVLKGYAYDWNTGRIFRPQVPQGGIND